MPFAVQTLQKFLFLLGTESVLCIGESDVKILTGFGLSAEIAIYNGRTII